MPEETLPGAGMADGTPSSPAHRRPRRRKRRSRAKTYAALDLGTNNCRLLIACPTDGGFRVVDSYSKAVKLGTGLQKTGRLSDESMAAAVNAIGVCANKMKSKSVQRWRCVATQACRTADNCDEFMSRVKDETGITLEIISPRVEARLSVMGCINLIDTSKDVALVIDTGGGSTELSWVDVRKLREQKGVFSAFRPPISAWTSLPIGVVSLSERVPEHENRKAWYEDLKQVVRDTLVEKNAHTRFTNVFKAGNGHLIGTSGTITSLAGIYQNLPYYQRDKVDASWMPSKNAVEICRHMAGLSFQERAKEPCIGEDRAKLLVAGCAITDVICEMWPSQEIRVADRGLREGILMGLMQRTQKLDLNGAENE
ncbi:MAG: Ppx/GppA family phosphatase [Hellea sp.]|nr:Ppx/GppA family phosphatase [Hellea sp.]